MLGEDCKSAAGCDKKAQAAEHSGRRLGHKINLGYCGLDVAEMGLDLVKCFPVGLDMLLKFATGLADFVKQSDDVFAFCAPFEGNRGPHSQLVRHLICSS